VEAERNLLREAKGRLEEERTALQREVERASQAQGGPEIDRLFRESLQMEVELKFAKDELGRLRGIEDNYEEARWRADKEATERAALEKECEAIERELVGKNRALMIEVEKTKMMAEQLNEAQLALAYLREEAERSRNIIYAREQDSARLSLQAQTTAAALAQAQRELADLRAERERLQADSEEVRLLQAKVAELERRNSEKLSSLESINSSLLAANAQTRELQQLAEERQRKAREAEGRAGEAEGRAREAEGELGRAVQERKMLEKRNEMIMEEIHGMKKRFEEEKGRSLSVTRHEEFSRLRTLESELEKRDKNISKLSKEKLELEEENVRINVQVMKLLSELEKAKAHSAPLRPK
jgi:chromosome segregation ATPase